MSIPVWLIGAIAASGRGEGVGGGGGGAPQAWTPAAITTALWFDASDSDTITLSGSPGAVSQWGDKIGNGRNAAHASAGPVLVTGGLNGLDVLRFNGATNRLATASVSLHSGTWSAFAVAKRTNTTGTAILIEQDISPGTPRIAQYLSTVSADMRVATFNTAVGVFSSSATPVPPPSPASITDWNLYGGVRDTTLITAFANGATTGSPTGTVTTGTPQTGSKAVDIGYFDNAGTPILLWAGDIAEIVLVGSAVDADTRQKMEGYLAHKWGLEGNLPAGHPYENEAPTV